ncbi:MAG: hypothetical protein PVH61_04645 [Candidatus Aminicenantes bacterium]|jgi:hypothetical protein
MNLAGFYPFTVSIWNFFSPNLEIKLKVTFHHHHCYFDENNDFKAEKIPKKIEYKIDSGKSLAFPMYFGDETLVLSIDSLIPSSDYQLTAGDAALCSLEVGENTISPAEGSSGGTNVINGKEYWRGGTWTISTKEEGWQLEIKKIIPDPQNEDVTVGPGTPG